MSMGQRFAVASLLVAFATLPLWITHVGLYQYLGIEVLDGFLSQVTGRETYERMEDKIKTLERIGTQGETGPSSQEHLARMKEALEWFPPLYDLIEPAKAALRSELFYDPERYKESLFLIDRWLAGDP